LPSLATTSNTPARAAGADASAIDSVAATSADPARWMNGGGDDDGGVSAPRSSEDDDDDDDDALVATVAAGRRRGRAADGVAREVASSSRRDDAAEVAPRVNAGGDARAMTLAMTRGAARRGLDRISRRLPAAVLATTPKKDRVDC
jgi:hypothetical protein